MIMLASELRETEAQPRHNPDLPRCCPQTLARALGGPGLRSPSGKGSGPRTPACTPRGSSGGKQQGAGSGGVGGGADTARARLEARSFTRSAGKQGFAVRICRYPR